MAELEGRVAIITGSTKGIGLATAQLFAEQGGKVIMNGRDASRLDAAVVTVPGAVGVPGDAADPHVATALVTAALEHFGRLDVAMANAAIPGPVGRITKLDDRGWDAALRTNLSGPFYLVRAAGRHMADQGHGSIIVVGSLAGKRGMAGGAAYSAAKAGLGGLVAAAAKDLASRNVRVNLLLPAAATSLSGQLSDVFAARSPFKRLGHPREIAQVALFLAGDRSTYMTGETINIDGGIHTNWGDI